MVEGQGTAKQENSMAIRLTLYLVLLIALPAAFGLYDNLAIVLFVSALWTYIVLLPSGEVFDWIREG